MNVNKLIVLIDEDIKEIVVFLKVIINSALNKLLKKEEEILLCFAKIDIIF